MTTTPIPFPAMDAPIRLYTIVSTADSVARMVDAGIDTVQLRNKLLFGSFLYREIERSVAYTRNTATRLFVNDYWIEAAECGAYGVHLGQEDLRHADLVIAKRAGLRLGVSARNLNELDYALTALPSYVMYSIDAGNEAQISGALQNGVQRAGSTPVVAHGVAAEHAAAARRAGATAIVLNEAQTQSDQFAATIAALRALHA